MGGSGVKSDAFANSGTANGLENQYSSQALGVGSTLAPALTAEATNPQGYSPATMGQMTTAAEQTAGGSNSGAAGQAGLMAARTRNAGSGQAATSAAANNASKNLSQVNAGIQTQNANLKNSQQQAGLSGLSSVYGTDVNAGENALGLSNSALGVANSSPNFWQGMALQGLQSGGQVGSAAMLACWIAAELYGGWTDPRTVAVRRWVNMELPKSWLGKVLLSAYIRWGEATAEYIQTHRRARAAMQYIFDRALVRARKGER